MFSVHSSPPGSLRPLSTCLFVTALSVAVAACGGGDDASVKPEARAAALVPAAASTPSVIDPIAALERRGTPLSTAASPHPTIEGVRPDVAAFIAALTVTDVQRDVLYQAARALQAALTVNLTRRAELQAAVNGLAQAIACMRAYFKDEEAVWRALQARSHDTLARRLRHALYMIASRLLAQQLDSVGCAGAPAPGGGDGGSGGSPSPPPPPPPPPPPANAAQQLREEIVRLEQQGVLPTLDRGTDIRGPDTNENGVRDDVEAYIVLLPITDAQNKAAMQTARVQQRSLLIDLNDKAAVLALGDASMAATACIGDRFEPDRHQSYVISERIEAITANTPERARRYMQYMAALSGSSTAYPEGNACEE